MKLERLALWDEKYLFTEQGETDKGYIGWIKGCFVEDRLVLSDMVMTGDNDYMIRYELESLCIFLASEGAGYMLRTLSDLNAFCRDKVHDHVPYSFNRECWGFRVLTEDYVWYYYLCGNRGYRKELSQRAREARKDRVCKICGKVFTPTRSDGIYCSNACRQKAYRTRRSVYL